MPTVADRVFRDFVRYTGDGQPDAPTGSPLPIGAPQSGVHNPSKREIRDWANSLEVWAVAAAGISPYASFAAATDTGLAPYILVGGRLYSYDPSGPFISADGRHWLPSSPDNSASRPILVLATGQSNMLGMSGATSGERRTINGSVFCWEQIPGVGQTVGWKCAGPDSPDWPWGTTGNSLSYHFCDMLQRVTGRPVYLVMHAAGGQPIAEWMPGGGGVSGATGAMFTTLNAAFQAALDGPLPGGSTLRGWGVQRADYLLWHQGEADADYTGTTGLQWIQRFRTVLNTLRTGAGTSADPMLQVSAPVLVGELLWGGTSGSNATDSRNAEIARLDREEPLVAAVTSRSLGSLDNLHFTGGALQEFGWRYFQRLGVFPKLAPDESLGADAIRIAGRVVTLRGAGVAVAAGGTTTVTLPMAMANAGYIPTLTLTAHGSSTPYPPLLGARTATTFIIRNTGGQSMTVAWSITDIAAG